MMLNNLIEEVRNRRVLALAALGVLVALALPLLFLKGAPEGAPAANAVAPAAATEAKLPARAARLLDATDGSAVSGHASGRSADPFSPPESYRAAVAAAAKGPVSGGSTTSSSATSSGGGAGASATPAPAVIKNPGATTPSAPQRRTQAPSRKLTASNAAVDIRFGPKADTHIKRAIPRQKALYIHGKLIAMFVKYSPSRKAAVFALAPGLHVTGDVKCRVIGGSCRYIDVPAGEHVWLTYITANRTIVNRRLDVVRIKRRGAGSSTAARSAGARSVASCLMGKLVGMQLGDALLDRDACQRS
jgi:hypothetical protein